MRSRFLCAIAVALCCGTGGHAQAPAPFSKVLDDFVAESRQELFSSREACLEWAREHYASLVDGSVGGNLLSKYSMLGRFYVTQESLEFLEGAIAASVTEKNGSCERAQLATIMDYLRSVVLHVPFADTMARPITTHSAT